MVGVEQRLQPLTCQRSFDGLAEKVPAATCFFVYYRVLR